MALATEVNAISTYFVTASAHRKRQLFQNEQFAQRFVEVVLEYRDRKRFQLHAIVAMPDHFHVVITVSDVTLERAVQLIKGGYSYRLRKEFGVAGEVWQPSYYERRIRDEEECIAMIEYIHQNPVRRGLCERADEFAFSSASGRWKLDALPQRLKPH